jgi:hypothetical protein
MLARTFGQYLVHVNPRASIRDVAKFHEIFSKNLDVPVDPDGPINPGGDDSDGTRIERGFGDDNDEAARLDAEMDADDDERDDDDEERLRDAMKREDDMKDPMRRLKSLDVVQICKTMSSEGSAFGLSEHDLVDLISKHAERTGTTFAKLFTAQDEQGVTLRKAIDVCKHEQWASRTATVSKAAGMPGCATLAPRVSGGRAARAVDNPKTALAQLQELVDAQRAANPALSESAAWLSVYTDPRNRKLAERERMENRPVATAY